MLVTAAVAAVLLQPVAPPDRRHLACPLVLTLVASGDAPSAELIALGRQGVGAVAEILAEPSLEEAAARPLLEFLTLHGDGRSHEAIRRYLFSPDPTTAALATRALWLVAGARAAPSLEFLLRTNPGLEQTQAILEGLDRYALPSAFPTLRDYAIDDSHPAELRALAARILVALDAREGRRWLNQLRPDASPVFQAQVESLQATAKADRKR